MWVGSVSRWCQKIKCFHVSLNVLLIDRNDVSSENRGKSQTKLKFMLTSKMVYNIFLNIIYNLRLWQDLSAQNSAGCLKVHWKLICNIDRWSYGCLYWYLFIFMFALDISYTTLSGVGSEVRNQWMSSVLAKPFI